MAESYIISIDQSTQGTKALLFNQEGVLLQRNDLPHRQIVNEKDGCPMIRKKFTGMLCRL